MAMAPYHSLSEARELVASFEDCRLPRRDWNHRTHLTVACWYLLHFDEVEACERVISGILRYNRTRGIEMTVSGGYHETLTLFWLAITSRFLSRLPKGESDLSKLNHFVALHENQKGLFFDYYSRDRIFSWRARTTWVEPDLRPLPRRGESDPAGRRGPTAGRRSRLEAELVV